MILKCQRKKFNFTVIAAVSFGIAVKLPFCIQKISQIFFITEKFFSNGLNAMIFQHFGRKIRRQISLLRRQNIIGKQLHTTLLSLHRGMYVTVKSDFHGAVTEYLGKSFNVDAERNALCRKYMTE